MISQISLWLPSDCSILPLSLRINTSKKSEFPDFSSLSTLRRVDKTIFFQISFNIIQNCSLYFRIQMICLWKKVKKIKKCNLSEKKVRKVFFSNYNFQTWRSGGGRRVGDHEAFGHSDRSQRSPVARQRRQMEPVRNSESSSIPFCHVNYNV